MSDGGIERILHKIRENSPNENIRKFLEELVLEEFENSLGYYKDSYKKKIEGYIEKGEENGN